MFILGIVYPLLPIFGVSGISVYYSAILFLLTLKYINSIRLDDFFIVLLICITLMSNNINLGNLLSVFMFSIFARHLSNKDTKYFAYGFLFGLLIIILWGIKDTLVGVGRSYLVNGLTSVIIGRYIFYALFLVYVLNLRCKILYNGLALFLADFIAAKAATGSILLVYLSNFFISYIVRAPILFATALSISIFSLPLFVRLIYGGDVIYLPSMVNRLVWVENAIEISSKFSFKEIMIGSRNVIESHFAFFDIYLNFGIFGLLVFFIYINNLFYAYRDHNYQIILGIFCLVLANISGGIWALTQSIVMLLLGLRLLQIK